MSRIEEIQERAKTSRCLHATEHDTCVRADRDALLFGLQSVLELADIWDEPLGDWRYAKQLREAIAGALGDAA